MVAAALITYAVKYSLEFGPGLLRSFVSPVFGEGAPPFDARESRGSLQSVYIDGDLGAKREVMAMMQETSEESSAAKSEAAPTP